MFVWFPAPETLVWVINALIAQSNIINSHDIHMTIMTSKPREDPFLSSNFLLKTNAETRNTY